jgi:FdhE protein
MTRDDWLRTHPFLQPVARLTAQIDAAVALAIAESGMATAALPRWNDYRSDFLAGVPLLRSSHAAVDLEPAGRTIVALVEKLAAAPLPGGVASRVRALAAELRNERDPAPAVVAWLRGEPEFTTESPGPLRHLGWSVLTRFLHPLVDACARWRDEERWHRSTCPTCGSPPAMARLIGEEHGRTRFLVCGCCTTRWRYPRSCCPFCERDAHRLQVISLEGEAGLRVDWCEACRGYLKTLNGQGDDELLLADWTSLHLDVLAVERGLKRMAGSLYEIERETPESAPNPGGFADRG